MDYQEVKDSRSNAVFAWLTQIGFVKFVAIIIQIAAKSILSGSKADVMFVLTKQLLLKSIILIA